MFIDDSLPKGVVRAIAGIAGIILGLVSIAVPLNFYLNLFSHPAVPSHQIQYGFWDGVSGSMLVLIFFAVFGFISLLLIKFAFTRPGSHDSPDDSADHHSASAHPAEE
ncbi:MAG: hypothetical protein WBQ34_01420 [Candidatus Acidiferrales bacterium]